MGHESLAPLSSVPYRKDGQRDRSPCGFIGVGATPLRGQGSIEAFPVPGRAQGIVPGAGFPKLKGNTSLCSTWLIQDSVMGHKDRRFLFIRDGRCAVLFKIFREKGLYISLEHKFWIFALGDDLVNK
jgi:hypothetical protein